MRAVRFEAGGHVTLVDVPTTEPGEGEVLVRVLAAGVCRTDLHLLHDVASGRIDPLVPGHEIAGTVQRAGRGVGRVRAGDSVVVHFEIPCGKCRACVTKRTNLCENARTLGFDVPGGYAEYVQVPEDNVLAAPPNLETDQAATLACSGATAYHTVVTKGGADERDLVVVIGVGGVGLSAVQVARARGARVVAVDVRELALEAARNVGAELAVLPDDALAAILAASKDRGADVVVDLVSSSDTMQLAIAALAPGGRLVEVATGEEGVLVAPTLLMEKELTLMGSHSSTMADFARAVSLAEAGLLKPVVTRTGALAEAENILQDLEAGKIVGRAVLHP
jgi:propanol-preferring alcohol dehydrogenase